MPHLRLLSSTCARHAGKRGTGFHELDATHFFWFKSPLLISRIFSYAYFENSLSIAIIIWTLAGGFEPVGFWTGIPYWSVFLLLALDVLVVIHSSLYVLPLYALLQPVGSHCPQTVLKRAIKGGLYPKQMAMIAKAMNLQLEAR